MVEFAIFLSGIAIGVIFTLGSLLPWDGDWGDNDDAAD